eukprot:1531695-Alexandrium_andersonii.AAC.1
MVGVPPNLALALLAVANHPDPAASAGSPGRQRRSKVSVLGGQGPASCAELAGAGEAAREAGGGVSGTEMSSGHREAATGR